MQVLVFIGNGWANGHLTHYKHLDYLELSNLKESPFYSNGPLPALEGNSKRLNQCFPNFFWGGVFENW